MTRNLLKMAFVCLFTVVAISSCKKDDDDENGGNGVIKNNTITAKVVDGLSLDGKVYVVKAEVEYENSNGREVTYVAANTNYINGGFTLKLPENVSDAYLTSLSSDEFYFPDGITVSNRNVKIGTYDNDYDHATLAAYDMSNNMVGRFDHCTANSWSVLLYANGDVSITGSYTKNYTNWEGITYTYTFISNIHLKKGWNMLYEKQTKNGNNTTYESTTTAPSDAEWWWED
jgi:hypothetical protein